MRGRKGQPFLPVADGLHEERQYLLEFGVVHIAFEDAVQGELPAVLVQPDNGMTGFMSEIVRGQQAAVGVLASGGRAEVGDEVELPFMALEKDLVVVKEHAAGARVGQFQVYADCAAQFAYEQFAVHAVSPCSYGYRAWRPANAGAPPVMFRMSGASASG